MSATQKLRPHSALSRPVDSPQQQARPPPRRCSRYSLRCFERPPVAEPARLASAKQTRSVCPLVLCATPTPAHSPAVPARVPSFVGLLHHEKQPRLPSEHASHSWLAG